MDIPRQRFAGRLAAVLLSTVALASQTQWALAEDQVLFTQTVKSGLLFANGDHLSAPYLIQASDSAVLINGLSYPIAGRALDSGRDDGRRSRARTREAPRFQNRRLPTVESARDISNALSANFIVIAFPDCNPVILGTASQEYLLCDALLATTPSADQVREFAALSRSQDSIVWRNWLAEVRLSGDVRSELSQRLELIDASDARNIGQITASQRLNRYAYPLTVVGMFLGVLTLGHMLKWTGRGLVGTNSVDADPATAQMSRRYAETALYLMLALSVLDLVWTILASRAGVMTEVNPLAARFLDSPGSLTVFKLVATSLGCGILYVWRHQQQIQQAIWWMCLVCVLLTFRWVMLDSLI